MANKRIAEGDAWYFVNKRPRVVEPWSETTTYLELLPTDVIGRILQHLARGCYDREAANVAKLGTEMQNAVFESLPKKLTITAETCMSDQVVCPLQQDPNLDQLIVKDDASTVTVFLALELAKVRNISFPRQCQEYIGYNGFGDVREFHINVTKNSRNTLFPALKNMSLVRLKLICDLKCSARCMFNERNPNGSRSVGRTLARSCPILTELSVKCHCKGRHISVWTIFSEISTLGVFCIESLKDAPESALPALLSVKKVWLSSPDAHKVGVFIGTPTLQISSQLRPLDSRAIEGLTACPQLRKLDILLYESAEQCLPRVFAQLPCLEDISLRWQTRRRAIVHATPGIVRNSVFAAKSLKRMCFANVRIDKDEMKEVLIRLGNRLHTLGLPIHLPEDGTLQEIQVLLHTISMHNPELRRLYTCQEYSKYDFMRKIPHDVKVMTELLKETTVVQARLRRLQRSLPFADLASLDEWVELAQLDLLIAIGITSWNFGFPRKLRTSRSVPFVVVS